jgi:2-amino-4-hydroxy-6-hydroxymethyldihydropteridine diphosphokinase
VYVGLGSNQDRAVNLGFAIAALQATFGDCALSSIYETTAMSSVKQHADQPVRPINNVPSYYNLVVCFESDQALSTVHSQLKQIETQRHPRRADHCPLDLDLLLFGDHIQHDDQFDLPRRDITVYAYVAQPLAELAPDQLHPESGQTFAWHATQALFATQSIKKLSITLDSTHESTRGI